MCSICSPMKGQAEQLCQEVSRLHIEGRTADALALLQHGVIKNKLLMWEVIAIKQRVLHLTKIKECRCK